MWAMMRQHITCNAESIILRNPTVARVAVVVLSSIAHWTPCRKLNSPNPPLPQRFYGIGRRDFLLVTLHRKPLLQRGYSTHTIYYSAAEKVEADSRLKDQVYDFKRRPETVGDYATGAASTRWAPSVCTCHQT